MYRELTAQDDVDEDTYRSQLKANVGYSEQEVIDRILDLDEKGKQAIAENAEGWLKLRRHHGEI